MRVADGIFYHEVFCIAEIGSGFRNLVKRGDGWAENVEDDESDLAFFRRFDEADVAQRAQGRRQETGAHVDQADGRVRGIDGIENPHLIRDVVDVTDIGYIRRKPLECHTGQLGVECARTKPAVSEVIKQRAGNYRLANTPFVRANQYYCGFCHDAPPYPKHLMVNHPPLVWRNQGQREAKDMARRYRVCARRATADDLQ